MKTATYFLMIVGSLFLFSSGAKAQEFKPEYKPNYTFALGLKFGGYENGISGKYFMTTNTALEGILGFRAHGLVVTGLYEINQQAFGVEGFRFYYGFGAHIGGVGPGYYKRFNGSDQRYLDNQILLGADGVIGLEYVIPTSPIAVSLDLNPRV